MEQIKTVQWIGGTDGVLEMIDQRRLPGRLEMLRCQTPGQVYDAIQTLAVRGAPAIGVAAAFGVCLALRDTAESVPLEAAVEKVAEAVRYLTASRPTAVNLSWALKRMEAVAQVFCGSTEQLKQRLLDEAQALRDEDRQMCDAIGRLGEPLVPEGGAVLTHCNAGALATAGIGTALAPLYVACQRGKRFTVYADETRPLLQGARLTAWELTQAGIKTTLVCDNMAAWLMRQGRIQAVFVGADRIAANGDTANKIGTLGLSILAKHYKIPFYVAAPSSTVDLSLPSGSEIPIEERKSEEITGILGSGVELPGVSVYNPAFDVTEAKHITAIILEKGIIERPNKEKIARCLRGSKK